MGVPICDAIVLPKCPLLFPTEPFKGMKAFFKRMGIPVKDVYQAANPDCVFIQLKDSRNAFTRKLIIKLRYAVAILTLRTYILLRKKGVRRDSKKMLIELLRVYIR